MNGTSGTLSIPYKLEDCVIGEEKTISLKVVPTQNDDEGFAADVIEVVDYEHPEEPKDEYADKSMKGHAPAVSIVISGKAKK